MNTSIDWAELQSRTGCPHNVYSDSVGLRVIELLLGEAFIRETTRGAVEWHPQCLLMMGILRILESETAVREAYRIYTSAVDRDTKAGCLSVMREIPNSKSLEYYAELLDDPDVAEQAVQLLEKQLWYSDSLREDAAVLRMIEMAEHHADPAVRETAMLIRERYFTDSDFTDT